MTDERRRRTRRSGPPGCLLVRRLVRRHRCGGDARAAATRPRPRPSAARPATSSSASTAARSSSTTASTGHVWDLDADEPTRRSTTGTPSPRVQKDEDEDDDDDQEQNQGDRRPPKAKKDDFGARPGRTTVLHPLDNDSAPYGRLLAIRRSTSHRRPAPQARDQPGRPDDRPDHLPDDAAGSTSLRVLHRRRPQSCSAHATVRVASAGDGQPTPSRGCARASSRACGASPAGGSIDGPRAPRLARRHRRRPRRARLRDRASAASSAGGGRPHHLRGRVRFTAPREGGEPVQVEYAVTDGRSAPGRARRWPSRSRTSSTRSPFAADGRARRRPRRGRPADQDPAARSTTCPARTRRPPTPSWPWGASSRARPARRSRPTWRTASSPSPAPRPGTYFLDYEAAYGNADPRRQHHPRRRAAPPERAARPGRDARHPHASSASRPRIVDVLANDVDPVGRTAGGAARRRADDPTSSTWRSSTAAGCGSRPGRASSRPTPRSSATRSATALARASTGEVVVSQRPAPEDNTPVTPTDRVTVRAGTLGDRPGARQRLQPVRGTG